MKKFSFSLQRMLSYKQSLYEKERNELARLRHERNSLKARRDGAEEQFLERDRQFRRRAAGIGVDIEDINEMKVYQQSTQTLLRALDEQIAHLDVAIAKQLQVVIELDKDVKGLEKLKEKQWEEWQLAASAEERERILELVSNKHFEEQAQAEEEAARAEQAARAEPAARANQQ